MGYSSLKFKNIEKDLITIITLIQSNQNICRYILYLDNDPLDTSKSDITDNLINSENIIPSIFDSTVTEFSEVKIYVYPKQGSLREKPLGDIYFNVDIIVPDDYWILAGLGQFRAFRIADEISMMIDGQSEIAGIGAINIVNFVSYKVSQTNYSGLSLRILINSCTLKA